MFTVKTRETLDNFLAILTSPKWSLLIIFGYIVMKGVVTRESHRNGECIVQDGMKLWCTTPGGIYKWKFHTYVQVCHLGACRYRANENATLEVLH